MGKQYFYKGTLVTEIDGQHFGSYFNVKDDKGNIFSVRKADVDEIKKEVVQTPQTILIKPLIEDSPVEPEKPEKPDKPEKPKVVDTEVVSASLEASLSIDSEALVLPVNSFTSSDINKLADKLPGIGKITLGKILSNRPNDGYSSLDEIKELNPSHLKWDELGKYIVFE